MLCTPYLLPTACGVGILGDFGNRYAYRPLETVVNPGGIGYFVSGFINTQICKEAYEILTGRFDLVFQSPVKRNRNSGRMFFFCVFKDKA